MRNLMNARTMGAYNHKQQFMRIIGDNILHFSLIFND